MHFRVSLCKFPNMLAAIAAIPSSTTYLDLSDNSLSQKAGAELDAAFVLFPPLVKSLDMSYNFLNRKKFGAQLAEVFAAIPQSVTSLNLSWNGFDKISGADLAQVLSAIPPSVKSLNLSNNELWKKSGTELAEALAAIPSSVTHLDLSNNCLAYKSGAELARALAAIPSSVKTLDLSWNSLNIKTNAELALVFAAIPSGLTVTLKGNLLFKGLTHPERDTRLTCLRTSIQNGVQLDLSGNGESDVQRAVGPLIGLGKQNINEGHRLVALPTDNLKDILSFFLPKNTSSKKILGIFSSPLAQEVGSRASENNNRMIAIRKEEKASTILNEDNQKEDKAFTVLNEDNQISSTFCKIS